MQWKRCNSSNARVYSPSSTERYVAYLCQNDIIDLRVTFRRKWNEALFQGGIVTNDNHNSALSKWFISL